MTEDSAIVMARFLISKNNFTKLKTVFSQLNKKKTNLHAQKWIEVFHLACLQDRPKMIALLMTHLPDLLSADIQDKAKTLSFCALFNCSDVAKWFLTHPIYGPHSSIMAQLNDATQKALEGGFGDLLQLLIDKGGQLPQLTSKGETPTCALVKMGQIETLEYLTKKNLIDIHKETQQLNLLIMGLNTHAQSTPKRLYSLCELLLKANADPNKADQEGNTPLHLSVLLNRPKLYSLFRRYHANDTLENHHNQTPFDLMLANNYALCEFLQSDPKFKGLP